MDKSSRIILLILSAVLITTSAFATVGYKMKYNAQTGRGDWVIDETTLSAGSLTGTISTGNPGYLAVYTGSTTVDDTSVIYTNGTNIGIGTSSPGYKLEIIGPVRTSSSIEATRFLPTSSFLGGNSIYLPATNTLGFSTNGTEKARIDANGNVGIGTTTPASSIESSTKVLDIAGVAKPAITLHSSSTAQESSIASSTGAGVNVSTAGHATATNNIITFATEETNSQYTPTERMRIASNGNVGIGTTTTNSYKLSVSGSIYATSNLIAASQMFTPILSDPVGAGNGRIYLSDTSGVTARSGKVDRLFMPITGNIGIMTSSPMSTLDVIGTAHISGQTTIDGNVGIGTSAPTHKVEILKTTAPSADILDPTLVVTHSYALSGAQVPTAIKGVYYNPGSGVTTTGHAIGVTGFTYDTAVGVADQFAIEGRANGFGNGNYFGGTFRSQWADPVAGNTTVRDAGKMIVGLSTKSGIYDYDQSTLRNDEGIVVGGYFGANDGGLFNYGAIFEGQTSGFINTTAAFRASTQITLHVGSDADYTTANAGITFGASSDTKLYRGGTNHVKTDGAMQIAGAVTLDGMTTGYALCITASKQLGHCTAGTYPACSTCVAN